MYMRVCYCVYFSSMGTGTGELLDSAGFWPHQKNGSLWGKTSSLKGKWQRLALSTFSWLLHVCAKVHTHVYAHTQMEKYILRKRKLEKMKDNTLSAFIHWGALHGSVSQALTQRLTERQSSAEGSTSGSSQQNGHVFYFR